MYLASAELAAIAAVLGRLPTPQEYLEFMEEINTMGKDVYRYLNFNEIESFQKAANDGRRIGAVQIEMVNVA